MGDRIRIDSQKVYEIENKWFLGVVCDDLSKDIGDLTDEIFHQLALSSRSIGLLQQLAPSDVLRRLTQWHKEAPLAQKTITDTYMGPKKRRTSLPALDWLIATNGSTGTISLGKRSFEVRADDSFSKGIDLVAQAAEWRDLFKDYASQFNRMGEAPPHYKFRVRASSEHPGNDIATIKYKMFQNGEINLERQVRIGGGQAGKFYGALGLGRAGFNKTKHASYKSIEKDIGQLKAEYILIPLGQDLSLAFLEVEMESLGSHVPSAQKEVLKAASQIFGKGYGLRSLSLNGNVREGGLRMNRGYKNIILAAKEGLHAYSTR